MYENLKSAFRDTFGRKPEYLFSAPGRTELGGNHTDHQRGKVLAAAVDLETTAAVGKNDGSRIRVLSEGYPMCGISLDALSPIPGEEGSTAALIRGITGRFEQLGLPLTGFDACVRSDVLPGSGLSSSAAFEVLIGTILNYFAGDPLTPAEVAQVGQYAENVYFGKPCGLMDQTASSVGGIIGIDFEDPAKPVIDPLQFDFSAHGYSLCIIDCGASHAELTGEYAAIPAELRKICAYFGKDVLREIPEAEFYAALPALRKQAGDRAVLRAMHVYEENRRAEALPDALEKGDLSRYFALVNESGRSSWLYLQNIVPAGAAESQPMAVALALASRLLGGEGACRVHGGGFAGTIQAYVPSDKADAFRAGMEAVFGSGCCHFLSVNPNGGRLLEVL